MTSTGLEIWLITVGEPLPNFSPSDRLWRSGYLSKLLASRGHAVTWWASSFDHFRRVQLVEKSVRIPVEANLEIQFLRGPAYRRNVSIARQVNHLQIAREFSRIAETYPRPALILCSFPTIELSREAVRFGETNGVPVYIDIRDLWPDEMLDRLPRMLRVPGRCALGPLYRKTRQALSGATGLLAISNGYLEWGLTAIGRERTPLDRTFPMGYTGAGGPGDVTESVRDALLGKGVNPAKKIFWFAGTFVGNIDLDTVIEAARILEAHEEIQFVLSGSGERDQVWRTRARGLDNVIFTGWVGRDELAYLASIAWAGLGAYRAGARMSLPNKLFEYMSAGLPVLLGLEGEARDLVIENEIGNTYSAGDSASLADAALRIAEDADGRARMSLNALRLFEERFSPVKIYNDYADFLVAAAD